MPKFTPTTFSQKIREINAFNAKWHCMPFSQNIFQVRVNVTFFHSVMWQYVFSWYLLQRKSKSLFGDLVPYYNYVCGRLRGSSKLKTFLGTDSDLICGNGLDCDELLVLVASTSAASQCRKTWNLLLLEKYFMKTTYSATQH